MADPTSSREQRDRERKSTSSSSRHSNRTISSTTLLLVLSLVLAVLAVLLSLPSRNSGQADPATGTGVMSFLTPKRSRELITRESLVAQREAEVARREGELLGGSPGGLVIPTCSACPSVSVPTPVTATSVSYSISVVTLTEREYETSIVHQPQATVTTTVTQINEIETYSGPPAGQPDYRFEDLLNRESRVGEREKDVGRREELVGRREADASHREQWIMDQLVNAEEPVVEEEVVYDTRRGRKTKILAPPPVEPVTIVETEVLTETETITSLAVSTAVSIQRLTVTVPEPAAARSAAPPGAAANPSRSKGAAAPGRTPGPALVEEIVEEHVHGAHAPPPPPPPVNSAPHNNPMQPPPAPPKGRRVVEVYEDDDEEEGDIGADGYRTVTIKHPRQPTQQQQRAQTQTNPRATQAQKKWFGGRF